MIEITGDIWLQKAEAICITTNGTIKRNGEAVMGRGVAAQAARKYKGLESSLGSLLFNGGNSVYILVKDNDKYIVSFPVKYEWYQSADLQLIERSCKELNYLANKMGWKTIVLPKPGCGNGKLKWEDVKPVVSKLDDRFFVIDRK